MCKRFCEDGYVVTGADNLNSYYDVSLKETRLKILNEFKNFRFSNTDLADKESLEKYGVQVYHLAQIAFNCLIRLYHARKEEQNEL